MNPIKIFLICVGLCFSYLAIDNYLLDKYDFERISNLLDAQKNLLTKQSPEDMHVADKNIEPLPHEKTARFSCQGYTHCSQMHSCDEAMFYLRHCPFPEMDGDSDGVPCERQWCH